MEKELIRNMVSLLVGEALLEFIENPTSPNIVNDLREKYSEKILSAIDSMQEEPNPNHPKVREVTGKLKDCVDLVKKDKFFSSNDGEYLQEEPKSKFEQSIQYGDNVVYNEELGCRINLSQLNRKAKKDTRYCMYAKDNLTNGERLGLCKDCDELCKYNPKTAAESLGISQEKYEEIINKCLFDGEPELVDLGDIPFGSRDSELEEAIYYIPDVYHAVIDGDKVIKKL